MNALVMMTGPHKAAAAINGKPAITWKVAVVLSSGSQPCGTVYKCLTYQRAVLLSCNMAHDRKLRLHIEALPP